MWLETLFAIIESRASLTEHLRILYDLLGPKERRRRNGSCGSREDRLIAS